MSILAGGVADAQDKPPTLPSTYVAEVRSCMKDLPQPSAKLYAGFARLGRGPEADAKVSQLTTSAATTYRHCLRSLEAGVNEVVPNGPAQRAQRDFTLADVRQRIADAEAPIREVLKQSRFEFEEQPVRYWSEVSGVTNVAWLDDQPRAMPSLAQQCGSFSISEARLARNNPSLTNATLKRAYDFRDCVNTYRDKIYDEADSLRTRLELGRIAAFYAPYVCGTWPSRYCVNAQAWQALSGKFSAARISKWTAMLVSAEQQNSIADERHETMEGYLERAEKMVDRWNTGGR
ncbi:hypothetical protein P6144_06105 [Sphingomonas sp. HITSZ_GF]|uniref:hypothetical protein n=1 Tax=Sphingomonas sp. HITSZ_GF TaxID=3037247 RepID=UPI00240D7553|nr:hypothetical protein [Sphingomonas sp. HITSZ_GF]MDG2533211.1 hypothetical protein [Sphingomonas sp. HITSZ_GF]